jgi:uncharacterized protein
VPAFFDFDAERNCLYSFATKGQKVEWMRLNPKVCVEIDEIGDQSHWVTILIFGWFQELHDFAGERLALERARALFQQRPHWWLPGAGKLTGGVERPDPVFYRILIDNMTGRRASPADSGQSTTAPEHLP